MSDKPQASMTDGEKFRFDQTGFLVRPAILAPDEIVAIADQIDRIQHDPESAPAELRYRAGQPASLAEVIVTSSGSANSHTTAFSPWLHDRRGKRPPDRTRRRRTARRRTRDHSDRGTGAPAPLRALP